VPSIGPPVNSENTDTASGSDGYYQVNYNWDGRGLNWLEDGQVYHFRIELVRPNTANIDGYYDYQLKVWIFSESETSSWSADKLGIFKYVRRYINDDYYVSTPALQIGSPQMQKTVKNGNELELEAGYHADLERILFGFTQGTGGQTQFVTVKNFDQFFIKFYPVGFPDNW
jgi:hypothetical protein